MTCGGTSASLPRSCAAGSASTSTGSTSAPNEGDSSDVRANIPQHTGRRRTAAGGRAEQIAPELWCSPGLSNSYLLTTGDGRVVVNTGMGFEGPVHCANFDAVDSALHQSSPRATSTTSAAWTACGIRS